MKLIFVVVKGSVINITSSPIRSQSNIGKVTVNFVSREIVRMIEFLRMIFVLKKSSFSCFKISLQASVRDSSCRRDDLTNKGKKTFPLPLL